MPVITIENTGASVEALTPVSILNNLLRAGVSIRHVCGGKALCGTCRITVLSGRQFLSPMQEKERVRLAAVGAGEKDRLACQTHTRGDITIHIVNDVIPPRNPATPS